MNVRYEKFTALNAVRLQAWVKFIYVPLFGGAAR